MSYVFGWQGLPLLLKSTFPCYRNMLHCLMADRLFTQFALKKLWMQWQGILWFAMGERGISPCTFWKICVETVYDKWVTFLVVKLQLISWHSMTPENEIGKFLTFSKLGFWVLCRDPWQFSRSLVWSCESCFSGGIHRLPRLWFSYGAPSWSEA